jgi:sugar (pentulose or hexulose) kinase
VSGGSVHHRAVLGLDLGTGGARALVVAEDGEVLAEASAKIEPLAEQGQLLLRGRHEQDPEAWWRAARCALGDATARARSRAGEHLELCALSVDGTSSTILGVDTAGRPTTPALMYDDGRAIEEASELGALAGESLSPTSGVAKMRWIERELPQEFGATHVFLHQADFVVACLTGEVGVTDASNALKSGYDLASDAWAAWLTELPGLQARLPRVVEPGTPIGALRTEVASDLGLPPGLTVVAGVSDGTAGFLASGATAPGEDNTTLGTTLVFKRVSRREVRDEAGLLYCHRLPGGVWLPGAASNVGGGWIRAEYPDADLSDLDRRAQACLPSVHLAYPLHGRGERFPFRSSAAEAFCEPVAATESQSYAARLQGTAFVERLAYEVLDAATGPSSGPVYATGGGARSDVWTQLRSDVCGRTYHRPASSESAFGSAVLAAGSTLFGDLWQASQAMVRIERSFHPDPKRTRVFDEYHARLRAELVRRGHLER